METHQEPETRAMQPNKDWVAWIDPWGPKSEPMYCCAPKESVVAFMRKVAESYKKSLSDAELLEDFLVVHWAGLIEQPEWTRPKGANV